MPNERPRLGIRTSLVLYRGMDGSRSQPSSEYGVLVKLEEMTTANTEYGDLVRFDSRESVGAIEYGTPLTFRPRRYV